MPLNYPPKKGQILLCDFSKGFKEPEMVKSGRPVIVISTKANLATVVACSTQEPNPIENYHYKLPRQSMPKKSKFMNKDTWVKCNMIYTVAFHRLELILLKKENGKRIYFNQKIAKNQMNMILKCILHGLEIGSLAKHLE